MDPEFEKNLRLLKAADPRDLVQIEQLLSAGADPNTQDIIHRGTPLQAAAASGRLDIVKILVQYGADVNLIAGDAPESPLEAAAIAGKIEVVEWLLHAGASLPSDRAMETLLADLSEFGEKQIIALLESWSR